MGFAVSFRRWLRRTIAPRAIAAPPPPPAVEHNGKRWNISPAAVADLSARGAASPAFAWVVPAKPHWLESNLPTGAKLAMDSLPMDAMADWAMSSSPFTEGLGFLGYAYLAELTQRSEYRRISEIWAAECTRKWIDLNGEDADRVAKLEKEMVRFGVREKFREATELDGFMGRGHIFMDFGDKDGATADPVALTPETIPADSLRNLKVVEPYWVYPLNFNTNNPLADDFYAPTTWQVMGQTVHNTRMLTFVGRELPDMLKPVYMFGGLSLSQMAKPYVDAFIRNRTSVSNLLYSFSTMVLSTNMSAMLSPDGAGELMRRIQAYVFGRDNNGLLLVDKETEELRNVSAPLGTVDALLAQSQEQISSVVGIPLVVLLGVTPKGLNASSEGELKAFYAHIRGYQEKTFQGPLNTLLRVLQLNMDGKIDESITFDFVDLWELDEEAKARVEQIKAGIDGDYLDRGVVDGEEVRERLKNDPDSPYFGVELQGNDAAAPGNEPEPDDLDGEEEPDEGELQAAAEDALCTLVASDAAHGEHWITVHPNGEEGEGRPLLVKSSGGGSYTVIGGAGGKLNGKTLTPKSVSKAKGAAGESDQHNPYARQPEDKDESSYAHRLSAHANSTGGAYAHRKAEQAHREAREVHLGAMRAGQAGPERDAAYAAYMEHGNKAEEHRKAGNAAEHGPQWASKLATEATERTALLNPKPKTREDVMAAWKAHNDAAKAHQGAHEEGRTNGLNDADRHEHWRAYRNHAERAGEMRRKVESLDKREKRKAKLAEAEGLVGEEGMARIRDLDARYASQSPEDIHAKWTDRWGLGFINDGSAKARRARNALVKTKAFKDRFYSDDPATRAEARSELAALDTTANSGFAYVKGHTPVDVSDGGDAAKDHRKMLGHVEAALEHLESKGYNIAGALKEANVHYTPAGTGKAFGHAFQSRGKGYLSMGVGKNALDFRAEQHKYHEAKVARGEPQWSTSTGAGLENMVRTTTIHELAHALGMQGHIRSPERLQGIMQKLFPDHKERRDWTHKNISEYATKDPLERDAELAGLVTRHDYVPGTLPKELEDHVAWLFNPKKGTE